MEADADGYGSVCDGNEADIPGYSVQIRKNTEADSRVFVCV
jgi:hypothetical protein